MMKEWSNDELEIQKVRDNVDKHKYSGLEIPLEKIFRL